MGRLKEIGGAIGVLGSAASVIALYPMLTGTSDNEMVKGEIVGPNLAKEAATPSQPLSPAPITPAQVTVPPISELLYSEARELLLRSGFRPTRSPVNPTGRQALQYGNGPYIVENNWLEVIDCSGTGLAPCKFAFRAPDERFLVLVTVGESPNMRVNDWWFTEDLSNE